MENYLIVLFRILFDPDFYCQWFILINLGSTRNHRLFLFSKHLASKSCLVNLVLIVNHRSLVFFGHLASKHCSQWVLSNIYKCCLKSKML